MTYTDVYIKYYRIVFNRCKQNLKSPALAEDATQETFMRLLQSWDRLDSNEIRQWLLTVAHNVCIDIIRKEGHTTPVSDVIVPEEEDIGKALMNEAKEIVRTMKPKYREIFDLIFAKGYKNQEAANILQLPLSTVTSRLQICVKELRSKLL